MNGWVDNEGGDSSTQGQQQELSLFGEVVEDLGSMDTLVGLQGRIYRAVAPHQNFGMEKWSKAGPQIAGKQLSLVPLNAENSRFYIQCY